jgi:hypothetical protein
MLGVKRKLRHGAVCARYADADMSHYGSQEKHPSERYQRQHLQAFLIQILSLTVKSPPASPMLIVPVGSMSMILPYFSANG